MKSVSTSTTVYFVLDGATYNAYLRCNKGDIIQYWEGEMVNGVANVATVYPDFEGVANAANQPELKMTVTSSMMSEGTNGTIKPLEVRWKLGGINIDFPNHDNGAVSIGVFAGYFQQIVPTGTETDYGIKILKNLPAVLNYTSSEIKCEACVATGLQAPWVHASMPIRIQLNNQGSAPLVRIESGDSNMFTIRQHGGQCLLKAMAYIKGEALGAEGLDYRWYRNDPADSNADDGGWVELTGQTNQILTVHEEDVQSYCMYKVKIWKKPAEGQPALTSDLFLNADIQGVNDISDTLMILVDFPNGSTIIPGVIEEVDMIPKVVSRETGEEIRNPLNTGPLFTRYYFVVLDGVGNVLNRYHTIQGDQDGDGLEDEDVDNDWMETVAALDNHYTVTIDQTRQAGGPVEVVISTQS